MLVSVQNFEWFSVEHLPIHKKDNACKHLGLTPNSFFMVIPFVKYVLRITWKMYYLKMCNKNNNDNNNSSSSDNVGVLRTIFINSYGAVIMTKWLLEFPRFICWM